MDIEVWKRPLVGRHRKDGDGLTMFLVGGKAFATWKPQLPLPDRHRIPVCDTLASHVLDARSEPCPHVGGGPAYGRYKSGYRCWALPNGNECKTVAVCTECGFFGLEDGSPRSRHIDTGMFAAVHPETTILVPQSMTTGTLNQADWDADRSCLTHPASDGRLKIVVDHFLRVKTTPMSLRPAARTRQVLPYGIVAQPAQVAL